MSLGPSITVIVEGCPGKGETFCRETNSVSDYGGFRYNTFCKEVLYIYMNDLCVYIRCCMKTFKHFIMYTRE